MSTQMNIHDAKTNLSKLVQEAMEGGDVVIAKAGKPQVRLVPVDTNVAPPKKRELGWAKGKWKVPDDIKTPFKDDIEEMFGLKD